MPQYNSALGLFHFASKHMTTKAQLEAQVTELQEQLAAAQAATPCLLYTSDAADD